MGIFDNLFNKKKSEVNHIEDSFDLENDTSLEDSQSLLDIIVSSWQNLDADIIAPYLSDDFQYNSVWVTATMNGKDDYLEFLRGKFENFKKTDNLPIVDVIDENGVDLPHFLQGEAEGVIDFQQKDGKIISMLMRPFLRIKVVDDNEWRSYVQAYQDFLQQAVQIAVDTIHNYANDRGLEYPQFSWLQAHPNHPSFQHLCFRTKTNVYSVLIALHGFSTENGEEDNSIVVHKRDYDNLILETGKNDLIPCILPISGLAKIPMTKDNPLIHAKTWKRINLDDEELKAAWMSLWELNNMGIMKVIDYLQKQGHTKISYCDVVGINPQIVFEENGVNAAILVRSIPGGLKDKSFEINKNLLKRFEDNNVQVYFADVRWANAHNNGNFMDEALWRGDGYFCAFKGLQKIEDAITNNDFIKVLDTELYDIK